jgi:protein involved in polysaccharide export with SLBB domain
MFDSGAYVQVRGGGGRGGKMFIEEGETLASFLPRIVRLGVDQEINRAVIEREAEDGTMQYIPVDLESIISGEGDGSIELRNGDIISIPQADNLVYVTGEVVVPGEVEFQKGLPAERYIALSGGPTRGGSMNKISIYSIDGGVRKGDRSSMVYRGDTILLERTRSSYIGPLFVGFTSITSLILSVIAVSK